MIEYERVIPRALLPEHYEPPAGGRVFVFKCPVCRKTYRGEVEAEPLCTGPNAGLDEHPHTLMVLLP